MSDKVATREELLQALQKPETEEFYLKSLGKYVKIAPASLVETHRILSSLRLLQENPDDAEAAAAWEMAWVVACVVEPELSTEDAQLLMAARSLEVRRLAQRCQAISGFGVADEMRVAEEASNIDTAEEIPGTAPLE